MENDFKDKRQKDLQSGCLKFSTDYVSTQQLFEAAEKWAESDKNVLALAMRQGGHGQIALDFKYDTTDADDDSKRGRSLDMIFKAFFTEYFGNDYMVGWDFSSPTTIVK